MKEIIFNDRFSRTVRIIVGCLMAVAGASYIAAFYGEMNPVRYITAAGFVIVAVANFTNFFGSARQYIRETETGLEVKTGSMLTRRVFKTTDVAGITFGKNFISVQHKTEKPVKITISFLNPDQRSILTSFLKDFAARHNISL